MPCPTCGYSVPPECNFCGVCGLKLREPPPQVPRPAAEDERPTMLGAPAVFDAQRDTLHEVPSPVPPSPPPAKAPPVQAEAEPVDEEEEDAASEAARDFHETAWFREASDPETLGAIERGNDPVRAERLAAGDAAMGPDTRQQYSLDVGPDGRTVAGPRPVRFTTPPVSEAEGAGPRRIIAAGIALIVLAFLVWWWVR
ncbi:MAG: zinc ribbon domain-containing protein [Myxococcales bacterium]|nr:zinc ribbon domain-containing protein [Myxococcales bacterium]